MKITKRYLKLFGIDELRKKTTELDIGIEPIDVDAIKQEKLKKPINTSTPINTTLCKKCKYWKDGKTPYCLFLEKTGRMKRKGSTYDCCIEYVEKYREG